jgi:DNA-binding transcriptional MerR regulator
VAKAEAEVYRPAEACRIAEVAPYVLRYWETEFSALSEGRDKAATKLYTARDVRIISRIRELLYDEGFTVAGAKKRLDAEIAEGRFDSGLAPAPPVVEQRKPTPAEKAAPARAEKIEKAAAEKPAPEKPKRAMPAAVPSASASAATAAQAAPAPARREATLRSDVKPAEPALDRRTVVRELKEIVRLLGRP